MVALGDWRSGSAAALHAVGRGFESLIAHHFFRKGPRADDSNWENFCQEYAYIPRDSNCFEYLRRSPGAGHSAQVSGRAIPPPASLTGSGSTPGPAGLCDPERAEIEKSWRAGLSMQRICQDLAVERQFMGQLPRGAYGYTPKKFQAARHRALFCFRRGIGEDRIAWDPGNTATIGR